MQDKDYALDLVDDRDFEVEILLGEQKDLPKSIFLKDTEIQNQSVNDPYGCVFYSGSTVSNTMNYVKKEDEKISGNELCKIAIEEKLLDPEKGAFIINAPKLLQKKGFIESYARCRSLEDIKISLANNQLVQTGSNSINWKKTLNNKSLVVMGKSYGHAFVICGYDDDLNVLICENSYGEKEYKNCYFFINYSDIYLLYDSKYIYTDKPRKDYEDKISKGITLNNAKLFYKRGFTNGLNPEQSITRQEFWATMELILQKYNNI